MPWLHELMVGGTSRALTIDGSQPRSIVAASLWWPSTSPQEKVLNGANGAADE